MPLVYARNKHVGAEDLPEGGVRVRTSVEDTLFSGWVEIEFSLKNDIIINLAKGEVRRGFSPTCLTAASWLSDIVGMRVAPGLTRKVDNRVGGPGGCTNLANLILECCHVAVVTQRRLRRSKLQSEGLSRDDQLRVLLQPESHRRNTCVVYSDSSPLLERLGIG